MTSISRKLSTPDSTDTPLSIKLASAPATDTTNVLAQFAFGGHSPGSIAHNGLTPLAGGPVYEIWRASGTSVNGHEHGVDWRAIGPLLFGSITMAMGKDAEVATRQLYQHILDCKLARKFPHLIRIWNFMPNINYGEGDSECYKRFCSGRAQVFDDRADELSQVPAATAIGRRGDGGDNENLTIHFLAAREPGRRIENPRQISAPSYPRRYGPNSPQFARATAWPGITSAASLLLVSGTASIVGHESQHRGDLGRQLAETWNNLEQLRASADADQLRSLRVYIRQQADYSQVRAFVSDRVAPHVPVLYLHADICRAELLLEIEAVYTIPAHKP